ncbi:MAG: aldo/keto reductase [Pseudomonadota bacterium]|nr:aldo/keto reductase [Pseudomonadota bacterium]
MTDKTRIGTTDLWVNRIGLGANAVGGHNVYGSLGEPEGKALVHAAIDLGIDFFDTAFIYGPERSEILIGEAVAEAGARDRVVLATKGAYRFVDGGVVFDNSPAFLTQCVEDSLRRLQTDCIDLFYIHQPDEATPKYEAVGALKRLKEAGKIRAIGVSNFSLAQLKEANRDGHVDVIQNLYNLFQREAEGEMLPFCESRGIAYIPYFPLAAGLLGGRYDAAMGFTDFRAEHPLFTGENYRENLARVEALRPIAADHGVEVAHIALAWCLTRPAIEVIIPGAKSAAQLQSNLKTDRVRLSAADLATIDGIFARD